MKRAELWPLELVPSPLLGGKAQTTPSASVATSFFYTTSPLNAEYASAVRASAEFHQEGPLARVSKLLEADDACSEAAYWSATLDARGVPDQSPNSLLKLRCTVAALPSASFNAAEKDAGAATPAALKQQLQVEADVILTEFRQTLSQNLRGLQQNDVLLDSLGVPHDASQQAKAVAASHGGGCHGAVQFTDETPTSWRAVGHSALLVEPAIGFLSAATPQSEAASCGGCGSMSSSGLGINGEQYVWPHASMACASLVRHKSPGSPDLSQQAPGIGAVTCAEGGFTVQASERKHWQGVELQPAGQLWLHFAEVQESHDGSLFHGQQSRAVMPPGGRLGSGWRAASAAGAVAVSSPALAPSVDLSQLLESPSPASDSPMQQGTPVSSRLGVSSLQATTEEPLISGSIGFGFAPSGTSDTPTPIGISRELKITPCSAATSAAATELPPVASHAAAVHGIPVFVESISTVAQQRLVSTPSPLGDSGAHLLLLSPQTLTNQEMSWASWASEAELISHHLVSSAGDAAHMLLAAGKVGSGSPATSHTLSSSRSVRGSLQLHEMGLPAPKAAPASPAAMMATNSLEARLSGAGEDLSLHVTPSELQLQSRGYDNCMMPLPEPASLTASSASSADNSPRYQDGVCMGVPCSTPTPPGVTEAPINSGSGTAWISTSEPRATTGWQVMYNPVFSDDEDTTLLAYTPLLASSAHAYLPGTDATVQPTPGPLPAALDAHAATSAGAASATQYHRSISAGSSLSALQGGDVVAGGCKQQGNSAKQGIGHFGRMLGPAGVSPSYHELRRRLGLETTAADSDDEEISSSGCLSASQAWGTWAAGIPLEGVAGYSSTPAQSVCRRRTRVSTNVSGVTAAQLLGTPQSSVMPGPPIAAFADAGLQALLADLEAAQALLAGALEKPASVEFTQGSQALAECSSARARPDAALQVLTSVAVSSANKACTAPTTLLTDQLAAAAAALGRAIPKLLKLARENSGLTRANEQLRCELSCIQTTQLELQARSKLLQAMLEERGNEVARLSKAHLRRTVKLQSQLTGCQERIQQLERREAQLMLEGKQQVQQLKEAHGHVASLSTEAAALGRQVQDYKQACDKHQECVAMLEHKLAAIATEQETSAAEALEAAAAAEAAKLQQQQHRSRLQLLQPFLAGGAYNEVESGQSAGICSSGHGSHTDYGAQLLPTAAKCCGGVVLLEHASGGSDDHGSAGQLHHLLNARQPDSYLQQQQQLAGAQELQAQLQDELEAARVAIAQLVAERSAARAEVVRKEAVAAQSVAAAAVAQAAEAQAREGEQKAQQAVGRCEAKLLETISRLQAAQQQYAEREEGLQQQLTQAEAERESLQQQTQLELHTREQQLAKAQADVAQLEQRLLRQARLRDDAMHLTDMHSLKVSQLQQQLIEERQRSAALGVEVQTATRRLLDFKQQLRGVSKASIASESGAGSVGSAATITAMEDPAASATLMPYFPAGAPAACASSRGAGGLQGNRAATDVNLGPAAMADNSSFRLVQVSKQWAGASSNATHVMSTLRDGGCSSLRRLAGPMLQLRFALKQVEQISAELAGSTMGSESDASDTSSTPVLLPAGALAGTGPGLQEEMWVVYNLHQLTATAQRVAAWLAACLPVNTSAVIRKLEKQLEEERAQQHEEQLEAQVHLASLQRVSQQLAAKVAEYEATLSRMQ